MTDKTEPEKLRDLLSQVHAHLAAEFCVKVCLFIKQLQAKLGAVGSAHISHLWVCGHATDTFVLASRPFCRPRKHLPCPVLGQTLPIRCAARDIGGRWVLRSYTQQFAAARSGAFAEDH